MATRPLRVLVDPYERDEPQWSRRPSWLTGGESIYALLGKFGALNALSNRELCELFVPKSNKGRGHPSYPSVDLRSSERIHRVRLANLFGLDAGDLSTAFVSDEFPNALPFASPTLVWCARCAFHGFHSAAFQLNFYGTCPLHRTALRRRCPSCGATLPYTLSARTTALFECGQCRHDLARELRTHRPELKLDDRAEAILSDHVRLVHFTDTLPTLFNACRTELGRPSLPIEMGKADVFRRCCTFQQFVADVLTSVTADPANPELAPIRPTGSFGAHSEPAVTSVGSHSADEEFEEARKLYRAVRRKIYRHVCRGHAQCIRAAQRALWWDLEGERTSSFCPTAMAYLRWRMQWEGCRIPRMLDSAERLRTMHGILGWLSGDAPIGSALWTRSLSTWIRHQLFVCALIDSFAQWQQVASQCRTTVVWRRSAAQRFGKRHWACCGRGTLFEPANFYLEPAYMNVLRAPAASGAHVRGTRAALQTIRR